MIAPGEVMRGLYGAYRLARFDADGLRLLDGSLAGFWQSFFGAVLVFPLYLALMLNRPDGSGVSLSGALIDVFAYAINWLAFPVLMLTLAKMLDRERHYLRYIVAVNWAAVLQNSVYIPIALLGTTGGLPTEVAALLSLMVLGWTLMYSGFIAHKALDVPIGTAAGLVVLDLIVGVLINGLAAGAHLS